MTTDFDCTVAGNRCTNRSGTADDSWSGTLGKGDHKIVVYPAGGGSGNYTLSISARTPDTGGSTGTRTQVTTLVDASGTNVSTTRTHTFTLARDAEVDVALTGMTIDFDCRVGSRRCTNNRGTADDSWSGPLKAGAYWVAVYPYDNGPGDYSLAVTATETLGVVATPVAGGPTLVGRICDADEAGNAIEETCTPIYNDSTKVTAPTPRRPLRPAPPPPPPEPQPPPDPNPTPTTTTSGVIGSLKNVIQAENLDCRSMNFSTNDRLGSDHGGANTIRRTHSRIDMQTKRQASHF